MWNPMKLNAKINECKMMQSFENEYVKSKEAIYAKLSEKLFVAPDTIKSWVKKGSHGPGNEEIITQLAEIFEVPVEYFTADTGKSVKKNMESQITISKTGVDERVHVAVHTCVELMQEYIKVVNGCKVGEDKALDLRMVFTRLMSEAACLPHDLYTSCMMTFAAPEVLTFTKVFGAWCDITAHGTNVSYFCSTVKAAITLMEPDFLSALVEDEDVNEAEYVNKDNSIFKVSTYPFGDEFGDEDIRIVFDAYIAARLNHDVETPQADAIVDDIPYPDILPADYDELDELAKNIAEAYNWLKVQFTDKLFYGIVQFTKFYHTYYCSESYNYSGEEGKNDISLDKLDFIAQEILDEPYYHWRNRIIKEKCLEHEARMKQKEEKKEADKQNGKKVSQKKSSKRKQKTAKVIKEKSHTNDVC